MPKTERITITIDEKVHKALKKQAKKSDRSKSKTANLILKKELVK